MAHAKEYGHYDIKRILTASGSASGKKAGIDAKYLDEMLSDLASHARNYPPQFDTTSDRDRAIRDVKDLSGMLDIALNAPSVQPDLLLRAGLLNSIGYNLDLGGSAEKTSAIFQRLLTASPDHARGNYMYGTFLAGAGRDKQAIPYLEKAIAVGVVDASYALGVVYVSLGDKDKALLNLARYQRERPGDAAVAKLMEGIRTGKVEVKRGSR